MLVRPNKLSTCSELELRLLCALAVNDKLLADFEANADDLAHALNCKRSEVDRAFNFWRGAGALRLAGTTAPAPAAIKQSNPHYTGKELAEIIDKDELSGLIDECQRILGTTFNPTDINTLVTMYHYLGVDNAFILMLVEYCAGMGKKSLAYIRKTAYNLYDDGVDNAEKLEAYIRSRDELFSLEGKLRRMFGIEGRALTAKENKCFENWCKWGFGEEIITLAYEITVEKTGKYTISYLDRILANWHEAGYKSVAEIEEAQKKYAEGKAPDDGSSFILDEFYEAALKRTRENAVKIKKSKES